MEQQSHHSLILTDRTQLSLSGVTEVTSFDDRTVLLYTALGPLTVIGEELAVGALSIETGALEITGEIRALHYGDRDRTASCGLLRRIFR